MKKVLFPLLIGVGLHLPGFAQHTYANLVFEPARPKPGEKVTITYDPKGTPFADAAEPQGLVLAIKPGGLPFPLPLRREGTLWKGELTTSDSTSLMLFTFGDSATPDNNNGKGYCLYTYTPQGKPSPGARAWLGFYHGLAWKTEVVSHDAEKAISLFEEEFK